MNIELGRLLFHLGNVRVCMCVHVRTSLCPPGYSQEHEPQTLMIGHQYNGYMQQEVTICINIEVNTTS